MSDYSSLSHTKWECKYHVVFIPKCRRKVLYGKVRQDLGALFHELAKQRESEILEGHCRSGFYGEASEFQRLPLLGTRLLRIDGGNR